MFIKNDLVYSLHDLSTNQASAFAAAISANKAIGKDVTINTDDLKNEVVVVFSGPSYIWNFIQSVIFGYVCAKTMILDLGWDPKQVGDWFDRHCEVYDSLEARE